MAALALVLSALAIARVWPFLVDDALIPIRYAQHFGRGDGYRFNPPGHGAASLSSDGVTPLPWVLLLSPLTRVVRDPDALVMAMKVQSALFALATAALVAVGTREASRGARVLVLFGYALSLPVAMYAASGMETSLASLLVALAFVLPPPRVRTAAALAGVAALFRPELVAFALPWAVLHALKRGVRERMYCALIAAAPFALAALVRLAVWGRPVPLALLAKPSDVSHGALYVLGACVFSGLPLLFVPRERAYFAAALTYLAAITCVGGDSMPFSRLVAPLVGPALVVVAGTRFAPARLGALVLLEGALFFQFSPTVQTIGDDRRAWMHAARARFGEGQRIASVDVGWLGLSHEGLIFDLAGVTDLAVASLPGGHTTKLVDCALLEANGVDTVLVLTRDGKPTRGVELALQHERRFRDVFVEREPLPTAKSGYAYRVYRRD